MDAILQPPLSTAASIPTWGWVVIGIIIMSILGRDKERWEYEAKFREEGIGFGEVELENSKKAGCQIEVEFNLEAN